MFIEFFTILNQPEQVLVGTGTEFGLIVYLIIFLFVFCETGFVIAAPFCPGDTLLFICGILIGTGFLNLAWVLITITLAAITGDSLNYHIGRYTGLKFLSSQGAGFIRPEWILRTRTFFSRYGGFTIIIGRFIPYVRSLAPFLAGVGEMKYGTFLLYNITGGIFWTVTVVGAGYYLGRSFLVNGYSQLAGWLLLISILLGVIVALYAIYAVICHRLSLRRA